MKFIILKMRLSILSMKLSILSVKLSILTMKFSILTIKLQCSHSLLPGPPQMTSVVYCFVEKVLHCLDAQLFVKQLSTIGFLIYWESLLSTQGDEIGMLEDFIVAIHDVNTLQFKVLLWRCGLPLSVGV